MRTPKIVTICGSTRFRAEIAEANRFLTLAGYIVLAPGVFAHDGDEITEAQKEALDELHFRKIDLARWIYVVNPGGYIGESTRREIEYARKIGKGVQTLVDVGIPAWTDEQRAAAAVEMAAKRAALTAAQPASVAYEERCPDNAPHLWVGRDGRPAAGDATDRCDACGAQRRAVLEAAWERVDPEGVAALRASAAAYDRVPSRVQARDEPCADPAGCDVHRAGAGPKPEPTTTCETCGGELAWDAEVEGQQFWRHVDQAAAMKVVMHRAKPATAPYEQKPSGGDVR